MLILANHFSQAKEVSIKDKQPDLSFVEQLSLSGLCHITLVFSDNNPERDKCLHSSTTEPSIDAPTTDHREFIKRSFRLDGPLS
jgi:hypothetical protein